MCLFDRFLFSFFGLELQHFHLAMPYQKCACWGVGFHFSVISQRFGCLGQGQVTFLNEILTLHRFRKMCILGFRVPFPCDFSMVWVPGAGPSYIFE